MAVGARLLLGLALLAALIGVLLQLYRLRKPVRSLFVSTTNLPLPPHVELASSTRAALTLATTSDTKLQTNSLFADYMCQSGLIQMLDICVTRGCIMLQQLQLYELVETKAMGLIVAV
jgi:hypothetical protein